MSEQARAGMRGATPPENYERYFVPTIGEPLAHELLSFAALKPGERVVDVGCGTGIVTRLAAAEVGTRGSVIGIDIEPGMIAVAQSVTPPGLAVQWRQGSAESLPLEDASVDVAVCQMTLQFVENRGKALREMHRVLVPGGRVVLGQPGPATAQFEALAESMGRHVKPDGKGFVDRVFSLYAPDELKQLLMNSGFRTVELKGTTPSLTLPEPREFLWQYVSSTPLAGMMAKADGAAQNAFEAEVLEAWKPLADGDAMSLDQPMVYARAVKQAPAT